MSDTHNLSDIEKAKLDETVTNISHLFIGDLIKLTDDRDKAEQIQADRDKLWLKATIEAGIFESRAYWIRNELKSAYKVFNYHTKYQDPNPVQIARTLFYYNREGRVSEFLTYMIVAYAERNNSKDYAQRGREVLGYLGIEYGLIDKKLEYLTLYEVIEKILSTPSIWDDGENKTH